MYNLKFKIPYFIKNSFSICSRQYIFFPVHFDCKEPGQGGLDILTVGSPVLLTAGGVHHEVGRVLQPVQDEADQVGLEVDGEESADINGAHKHQVAETDTDEGPGHLYVSALYLSPSLQNSKKNDKNLSNKTGASSTYE